MPENQEGVAQDQELHRNWYKGPDRNDASRFRPYAVSDKWGIKIHLLRDASPMSLKLYHFTEDQAGVYYWMSHHTRTSATYTLYPLNEHPHAHGWEVRITCRGVMKPVTVTSRQRRTEQAERVASVHNLELAMACAHEHIRRMSSHVIRETEPEG